MLRYYYYHYHHHQYYYCCCYYYYYYDDDDYSKAFSVGSVSISAQSYDVYLGSGRLLRDQPVRVLFSVCSQQGDIRHHHPPLPSIYIYIYE